MFFEVLKPLNSIEKQKLFWILGHSKNNEKTIPTGNSKIMFLVQNGDMGLPGSSDRLIFDVLVRCQKIIIFWRLPDGAKNRKNRALGRQGPKKSARSGSEVVTFKIGGRGGASRALSS